MLKYVRRRKTRKRAREILHHARHVRNLREDLLKSETLGALRKDEDALRTAIRGGSEDEMKRAGTKLADRLGVLMPRRTFPVLRENLEVIVVAVAVAMAFRTYFIQPFKIPTGSMQPSLYGIVSTDREKPKLLDRLPFRAFRWIVTGELYREVKAKAGGTLDLVRAPSGNPYISPNYPGDFYYLVAGHRYRIPRAAQLNYALGGYVPKGGVLWAGSRTAGDHVFVNKVSWNFRRPRRAEIMVFSTRGIEELESGLARDRKGRPMSTHYIKRMSGLPGETLSIVPPHLYVDGKAVRTPETMRRIADCEPGYAGYKVAGRAMHGKKHHLSEPGETVQLGDTEYFALGDNTGNSRDSRYWGTVPRENLIGPACMIYWPFSKRWGRAK